MSPAANPRVTIITFSDTRYFSLLKELVLSVRKFKTPEEIAISVFSAGLREDQKADLSGLVQHIEEAEWNFDLPWLHKRPQHRKARTCAPFAPRYFPGYDVYVWIDADAWVNDWAPIDLLIRGAERGALAISPEVDRAYERPIGGLGITWLLNRPVYVNSWMYKNAKHAFGRRIAREMALYPVLNAGVYALRHDAPHWAGWERYMGKFLGTGRLIGDQISLNLSVYREGLALELLPAYCNWLAIKSMPKFDKAAGRFVEPYLPHLPIGVLHLTCFDEMREDPSVTVEVENTDGTKERRSLRFQG